MNDPCSCSSGCDCGCCEGTAPLTPMAIANRPGLDALAYRIGTHSSFLETMKARLSSQAFPGLAGLSTRDSGDAALALLDAWATVADVLTFYQERIANEGYLRTATERRSVLELARLVGYSPRPGVAASTYLAYSLDEGPETRIPAGAAVRSVPRPGELPQTFETGDDLVARAAWNLLPIRLTRPQQPAKVQADPRRPGTRGSVPLYLKGITTNLKINDPLLVCTGEPAPELFRVLAIAPDGANDRTRVDVRPWWQQPETPHFPFAAPAAAVPRPSGPELAAALRQRLGPATDLEALRIARGGTAQRVLSRLDGVTAALDSGAGESELRAAIAEALPELRREQTAAAEKRATRIEPWIGGLIEVLEGLPAEAGTSGETSAETSAARSAAAAAPTPAPWTTPPAAPATTDLASVLKTLGKPPAAQVRSAAHLDRDVERLFGPASDLAPRMLAAAKPELAGVLYPAWANLPATRPPVLKVCALKTRAAVFGHNAPREPVRNGAGIVTGTKEWDLSLSGAAAEAFEVQLSFRFNEETTLVEAEVTLEGVSAFTQLVTLTVGQPVELVSPDATENIVLTPLRIPDLELEDLSLELSIAFEKRALQIGIVSEEFEGRFNGYRVSSTGAPPTEISITTARSALGPSEVLVRGEVRALEDEPEAIDVVFLDNAYPQILPADPGGGDLCGAGYLVLQRPERETNVSPLVVARVLDVAEQSRAAYGITGKTTRVVLDRPWLRPQDTFATLRGTTVFAQCEELELAEEPLDPIAEALCGDRIELAGLYDGLQPGRWLIVSGERVDVGAQDETGQLAVPVRGVPGAELAMVAAVGQGIGSQAFAPGPAGISLARGRRGEPDESLAGERPHTTLTLAQPLAYCYKRDTLRIYGNVVKATHGETRFEVLGSGDAARANQSFPLKQPPLTFISAPTPSGIASTLEARVNDLLWHPADCPAGLGPAERRYFLRRDDGGATSLIFGDGRRGARLPTGSENVRAKYRSGIGPEGNLEAGQLSQLATRPLGVKDVINPLPATGGAGPESRDQARRNAPLAVLSLDRLVAVQDYADFARTFAGVGKSSATRISDGRVELVHLTIAGEDDIPIGEDSDLFRNLQEALLRFGEPRQPLMLALRRRAFLAVEAYVRILPDHLWEKVEARIRAALLEAFGFARRELGQDALLSEVYRTIQGVAGVDHLDVDLFASADPEDLESLSGVLERRAQAATRLPPSRLAASLARIEDGEIRAAQLLYLTPAVADTLILKERKS